MSNTHDQLAGGMAPPTVSAPHHGNGNGVGGFFHRLHDAHNADLQEGHGAASAYYSASAPASNAASTGRPASTQDPLVAFEHQLLAHPHPHLHAHPHPAAAATLPDPPRLTARSLTVPTSAFGRNPSPSPSPDARRCMAATDAWTPRLDRRQSWDGQAYRRAMMVKATGLLCGAGNGHSHNHDHGHDSHDEGDHTQCLEHHHHLGHFHPHGTNSSNCSVCSSYEANRGFSECADPTT